MNRTFPVASKACAERLRKRDDELRKQRIKSVRPQVDTSQPTVIHMDHLRNNLKREQLLEERYHEIDRANRLLLQKMSDVMKQPGHGTLARAKSGLPSLNRDARKMELMRITQENTAILKRIQRAQPVYNHIEWEDSYRRSFIYLKNKIEYPLVLKRSPSRGGSLTPLTPMGGKEMSKSGQVAPGSVGDPGAATRPSAAGGAGAGGQMQYVLKAGRQLGSQYYLLEMATDGRTLAVSAYDGESQRTLELVVNERNHRRLYREANGDYNVLAERLRVDGDQLTIDLSEGPLDSSACHNPATAATR